MNFNFFFFHLSLCLSFLFWYNFFSSCFWKFIQGEMMHDGNNEYNEYVDLGRQNNTI